MRKYYFKVQTNLDNYTFARVDLSLIDELI